MKYKYHNRRPDGQEIEDCVCRAISTATGLGYYGVANLLKLSAEKYQCDKLCVCCYNHLLEDVLCYKRIDIHLDKTVEEVVDEYSENIIILRIRGHLTCALYGVLDDIWDCDYRLVDCIWIIK